MSFFFEHSVHNNCLLHLTDCHLLIDEAAGCRFGGNLTFFGDTMASLRLFWGLSPEFTAAPLQLYPGQVFVEFMLSR